jgi:6-phosphogluconolactonase
MPADNIHPFPVDASVRESRDPQHAAEQHAAELRALVPSNADGVPIFDLILLGVGPDGHVLSVFPDSAALRPDAPLVVAVPAPTHIEPHVPRLTLSPRVLNVARNVVVTASGSGKAAVLGEIFGPAHDPRRLPAQLALTPAATWLLDRAAAARLTVAP